MTFEQIKQLVAADMTAVDERIKEKLASDVALVNQLGHYIVNSGGKRLRPIILILMAKALGYKGDQHINLAAVIEFIHTATLLHDDVVDESDLRRGNDTANALFGNAASVLGQQVDQFDLLFRHRRNSEEKKGGPWALE